MAQVSWQGALSNTTKNYVLRSPEAFDAGRYIGEEPRGLFGTIIDNTAGGLEGMVGGAANALGTAGKALYQTGDASRAIGEAGKWLVDRSIDLGERAAANARRSGLRQEYADQGLVDRITNPSYWLDSRGFVADASNMVGSMIPFAVTSAVLPEVGVAGLVSGVLGRGAARVGANKLARSLLLDTAEERGAARAAIGDFTSWAPTGVLDAASNTGEVAETLRAQGYSDADILPKMGTSFLYEIPYDIGSQGLFGALISGKGLRSALKGESRARNVAVNAGLAGADALNEGFQEHVQTQANELALGKPVGTLWNQTPEEASAFASGAIGGAVPLFGSAARNVLSNYWNGSGEVEQPELQTSAQEESAPMQVKSSGNADIDSIMTDAAAEYNVPVNLIHAVAQAESGYNQDARSEAGAIGVMQLMPGTAEGLGVDPTDLRGNIYGGAKYLRQLMDTFGGDIQKVIAAYNAGPGAVQKYGGIPPYEETQNYVQKVMGNLDGYDLGGSGDVPVQVRSLADDAAPFIGVTMDNGTEGCVEAVTKIGANSSAFLAQELKNGVVNVDRLVEDAGDNVIAFDPNQLEEGDVIVYGDESDPQRHVVLYDGKGGYIGNSSSRNLVVHESDYNQMGDWHPTKIIKSGALFRGTSVRPISAPQMDFTGLVFDEKDIAATQKALNNLVHGGQPTPEQSAAILSAAEAIRDMPLGSVDKTAEAESYNEWQKLIDTKDIAGIVDKDPEGVARMVHQLAGAQKQQQTRAAIENQQQIEATKQAIAAIQQQRIEAAQARINNAVAQRNATVQNPQMQAEAPMQGAVQTPQIPMQAAPTNNIVGDTVVEDAAPQTFSSPVEEAAKSLPVSREELSGILGKVQQWEQPLLSIPAYVQARDRQDWATAAQIAANAGQPGVAQFYNTLMEHGSRNAQNVTPVPQENAPTVTPYAPQENVVAAPPVQNASAPIPVVGVRPLVPERLPDSTTGRRDLAHALGRFMVANNIPISKGLRDDLSIGYGKAIRYADEKIRKWENERAGNAPQTAQDGAQSAETQADDRMLAQRGERAQSGSKAVRGKSAQKQGNKKAADKGELVLADGYETESGRPLTEADPKEFIIKPNGSRNFGEITKAISNAVMEQSGVSLPIGEIRLRVGDKIEGLIHAKEHTAEARSAGYNSVEDLIADVAENFNQIYMREPDNANGKPTYSLVKTGDKKAGVMNGVAPIYFELQTDGSGNYYIVISAIPKGDKSLMRQTKKDHLIYSSPGLGAATVSGNSAVSHDDKAGAANRGGSPTSDKSGDLDTSTISPEEAESKENPLHEDEQTALKGLSADAKDVYRLVREKLAGSSNKKVARAASVGAVLLARHADIIARKIRTALGKPFTAMDYYRNMFALKTEGDKTGANVLHQAANAGGKMYAQSAHAIPLDDGQGKVVDIQFVDVDEKRALQSPHIGIRFSDEEYKIGDDVENSHNWVDGDWTDEELDGTSTVNVAEPWSYDSLDELKETAIKRLNKAGRYPYDYAYLVAGTSSDYGEDANESIIRNAEVVGILKLVRESEAESFNQSAWHGTPHDFDGFDLGAIGTGEGAQVHGWGLYFAQNREVSQGYRERLKQPGLFYDGKEKKELPSDIQEALDSVFKGEELFIHDKAEARKRFGQALVEMQKNVDKARDSLAQNEEHVRSAKQNPNMSVPELLKKMGVIESVEEVPSEELSYDNMLKELEAMKTSSEKELLEYQRAYGLLQKIDPEKIETSKPGSLFEVGIPDNDVLLDEDKPFEYQPPFVQEKLLELFQNLLEQHTPQFLMDTHEFGDSVRDGSMAKERVSDATGKEIYDDLIDIFDKTPKEASLALNNVGIKGITYVGRQDGRCFVVFDDKAISIINKFNQQMNEIIKGTTQDIPNGQRIISLFEAADESTFLHEMGHLFLLDLEHLAPMSPTAEKDLATVKKWAAWREGQATEYKGTPFARSFAELDKKIRAALSAGNDRRADNLKRQWEHERFARGFEMYLKHGEAPTKGLRAVFAKFRAFLQRVYQAFTGTGGKATPEVEEVMARMISIEDSSDLSAYPRGKETEVYTDSGKSIPVQYRVVSADDLIASHDASALEINPGYPSALQPRDRERVVMRQQVERMSNTLRPEELGEGRNLNQGAPLIRSDGVVLNGNGRTIAIARAQARNRERAAAYRNYLMENAETFGLSREAVERVDNPVLVREVQGDISADAMNDIIGSTTGGSRMGASENAQADADKLTHTVMDTYVPNEKGDLTTAANRDFVAGVLHKVVGQGELNAYLDKDGHVNADGIQRVKRALFAAAYGDDEIVAKMAESTDDDTRNVSNGLMAAAPMMARLSVKKDVPYIRELRDAIADAVKQLDTLRRSGDSVKDYLGAQALFSEHEDSAEMREILSFLDENKRSGKRIGNYFTHIAEALDGMENPTDSDLFETQLPSLMDVLEEAKTHAETGGQDGLFGDSAEEDTRVQENIARGKKAMRTVVATHQDVPNAMNRPDIGTIDFVWGKAGQGAKFKRGNGIAHILAKNVPESGAQLLDQIVETIAKGNVIQEKTAGGSTQSRLVLEHNGYVALLSMNDESGGWLLSGWETYDNMKKRASSANGEGDGSTVATATAPMRSRRGGEDALSSDSNIAQEEAEGKQEPTLGLFFQTEPALEKAALEYGAKSENGKVTFADAAQEKEFLKVAKALLSAGARKFSKAWTGSAADYDVPSLDYVGTGTGGAAYGYGLYYAEKRKTAEGYGDKLYHAEIPNADVLLDAGKSFDEQPPKVRKALEKLVRGLTLEQLENWNDVRRMGKAKVVAEIMDALSEADGTNIYGTISDLAEGQKEASELLNKYGVKGAVYNDEQNGRTFVVFDDKAIKILEKFSARRQEEIKKMLDGIALVSPNRLSPRKRALRDWGHEMGVPVVFFKGDPSLHGFHSDGVTFLNVDSEITPQWTFWHEAMHWMKANNPDLYNDIVHEISGAEGFTKEQLDAYRKEIGAEHMSDADVIEEMIADALPDVRRRVPLLRDVGKRDTGIVERLVAWVHDVMRRFHDHFFTPKGGLTNDQRRAMVRAFGNLVGSIRDADGKQIFRVANDGARITLRDGKPLPAVKYSQTDKSMKWIAEHPFTYDDAQSMDDNIARAERLSKEYIDTFGTTDQINTSARQSLRREIADKLYGDGAAKKEGKVWLVLGVPASGKSTFSDPLVEREGALLIDSDEAKKMLPEFSNGLLAGAVHEESANIAETVFSRAMANNDNMVLPLVGKTMPKLQEKIDKLKEAGYKVNLIYVDLPVEKAIERTKARFRHTERLVPPDYLRKVGLKPRENYDKLKVTKEVDSYEAWDSDVARGSHPRLIESTARPEQKASTSGMGGRGQHARSLDEGGGRGNSGEESRRSSLNNNRSDNQDGFSMPKFSARTNGESRVGNFRRMMDALKSGVKPSPRVEVHDGRREVTADIGVSQVKRFMKDKRLTDDEVISRRELPNGKVRITYYARSAMDIGYADYAKSVRQVAKRNPFVKALYDLASKAMHKQEKLRNDFAKSLKEFTELVKNPADMEKVTEILWTGDATGKEYTSAELRAAGASDNVVRAYTLVRRELKKAYELLNETRMQVKTRSKVLRPEDVESYMQSHWIRPSDALSKTQTQDGNIELTWRGGKTYETKNKLMSAEELSLMEKDENINVTRAVPANAKAYGAGMYHVGYVERIKPINNLTGYMPHFFHEWMVYEQYKDPVSKEIRYTSVGSGRTLNEAVKIGNTIAEKNKDRNYVVRPKGFDMDAGNAVVVGDMEFAQMAKKLTESTQMSLSDARTFLRDSAGATLKSRHRFFGNMMKRKGAEGFDKNIMWVLAHYFNSSARYIAMEDFKPSAISLYERCFGAFDSEPKNMTARYCKDLINDVNGNPRGVEVWLNDLIKGTWLGKRIADSYGDRAALAVNGELSTWNAITKLGLFNFASMAVNFSQFINVGAALNDYGYAAKGLMRALHPSALDEKIIEASGLLEDINLAADNGGYSQRRGGRAGTVYQKAKQFGEWTLTPFQKADTLMRKAAVLGAYYQGVEKKGMEKAPGDELSAKAIAYAQQINDDANFDYSAANAPGMLRAGSVITQQLFQFQKYPIMQFEFMYNILKNGTRGQKVRMLVPYVLFCGIGGSIPFGELFNQLFSFLFGIATGDDEDIARDIKAEILRWAGKDPVKKSVAETALYGVLAPTFGLDISGRIGMSNAFSGEFYGQKPDSVSGVVAQQLGGPMAATAINMLHQAHEGNPIEALKAVSPALGNMAQAYVGVSRTTHHRVNTRYDSAYDKIAHALGFRSVEESTNAFVTNYDYEMRTKDKHTKQDAIQSYIDDPSDANRRTLNALGITDRQVKEAQIQQERTAKERAKNGRPNTNGENRSSQHKKEVKRETLLSATDDEE